jgi:hypothetical protein
MRRVLATAAAALLVTACGAGRPAGHKDGRHQYRKVKGTLLDAPPGITGRPVCVEDEITGGAYGAPRYEVTVDLRGLHGPAQPVFYSVFLTAAKRSILGSVTGQEVRRVKGHAPVRPPDTFGDLKTAVVQPADRVGVLQIPRDLTACQVRVSAPTPLEQQAGGRGVPRVSSEPVVVGANGVERPMSQR